MNTNLFGDIFGDLSWRGLIHQHTPGIELFLNGERVTGYIGFDPSFHSLHVGSLVPVLNLQRMQRFGHAPIAIVGGATGMIGDPSGKSTERNLLSTEQVQHNLQGIRSQLERFLDFTPGPCGARIIDNSTWFTEMDSLTFLREVGKHFSVNQMLAKDSVRKRLEGEKGISFTEFAYQLLQAYDFLVLHQTVGCTLQMEGSDQWGNITAGIDLIRRVTGARAHGLVFPLVTRSNGMKFGKSEAGTVWLDPKLTSPFRFYQFWLNTDDQDVIRYLNFFTFLSKEEIAGLRHEVATAPERREAQQILAYTMTQMVHGAQAVTHAQRAAVALFEGDLASLSVGEILNLHDEVPITDLPFVRLAGEGMELLDLLMLSGLAESRTDARRLVEAGGVYLNHSRVENVKRTVTLDDALEGKVLLLRRGKKQVHVVHLCPAP